MAIAANPIIALVMAFCMMLSPAAGYQADDEVPALTATFETIDGMNLSAGLNKTESGLPVVFIDANGLGLTLTGETGYLADDTGTYAVPVSELLERFSSAALNIPEPTEDDMMALMIFAQGVMEGVSTDAFTFSVMGNGMSFAFDLDKLAHDLHTVVPSVLTTYASYLNPTMEKYSPYLFGDVVTAEQLAQAWPELGLDQVETGLSAKLTVLQSGDTLTLIGSVAEVNFVAKIGEDSFSIEMTTADGTTYAFDTADFETVAQLLGETMQHITADAFSFEQTSNGNSGRYEVITTTIRLDTAALNTDLNRGLASTIAANSATVDGLLNKYRSWIALMTNDHHAARMTASSLVEGINNGATLINLPETTGELAMVVDQYNETITVDSYLGNVTLDGKIFVSIYGTPSASFIMTVNDRYDPVVINFDYAGDRYSSTMTLSSNIELFDLFRTLTISTKDYFDYEWHLSTDTNVIRADYSDEEQYMALKLGPVNAKFHIDENDATHFDFYAPEFFAELHIDEYGSNVNFDSTIGGFDYAENYYGFNLNGYLVDHYRYRSTFGLSFTDSYSNSGLTGYLNTSYGETYEMSLHNTGIDIIINGDLYTVRAIDVGDYSKVGLTLSMSDQVIATLVLGETDTQVTLELYQGSDISVTPFCKLTIDADPAPYVAPTDVTVVDAMTFLEKVDELF